MLGGYRSFLGNQAVNFTKGKVEIKQRVHPPRVEIDDLTEKDKDEA